MNRIQRFAVFSAVSAALLAGPGLAIAQDDHHDQAAQHDNHTYVEHKEWKKGYHMKQEDWGRGERVDDWKAHQLRQPPRGYEWRQVDGNYVMARIDTGVVNAVVAIH